MAEDAVKAEAMAPTRSQSVGSLMELTNPAEKRIKDLISEGPKRKLETTVSTNIIGEGLKRRDKIIKENTVADITIHGTIHENASMEDASMTEAAPLDKSLTRTISRDMDIEDVTDPSLQGAACKEIIEDSVKKEESKKPGKVKKTPTAKNAASEGIKADTQKVPQSIDKENVKESKVEKAEEKPEVEKTASKKKLVKKKVLTDKNENAASKTKIPEAAKAPAVAKAVEVPKAEEKEVKPEGENANDNIQVYSNYN